MIIRDWPHTVPVPSERPTKEELYDCLGQALERIAASYRSASWDQHMVERAIERTRDIAVDQIVAGHAEKWPQRLRRVWLSKVFRNQLCSLLRLRQEWPLLGDDVLTASTSTEEEEGGPIPLDERTDLKQVAQAVNELPPHLQEVVRVRYYDRLSERKAAERLGLPLSTFRNRQGRAIQKLKEALNRS